ncbi:type I-C CRISPR-associated endonuclease Cas1c [Tahibacter amnicola]|uniref:CRISPR-associated endonuclease Cas1 n=1 Tax=Tahibacter amnicola TaxID=2976241 RepID=A0ABY6BHG8_9GAMM|nr:type I-C CRISPR-associated endonuclease Cas1c [Tahibacter amnicola]UXI67302.1 type I-C CRISPR-associated endonuclease Cas1c [Tahibacter amnicola]
MRPLLNTLYVTTEGAWLRKDGENVVIDVEKAESGRLPLHLLSGIVCFGNVLMSPALMGHCCELGICVSFLTMNGRFLARVEGAVSGNVLLRREQYRCSDDPSRCAAVVCHILLGKIHNQRAVIRRAIRDHASSCSAAESGALVQADRGLAHIVERLHRTPDVDSLRGLEGDAARRYFDVFRNLIRVSDAGFQFEGRSRRPPRDRVNALLSFLYTLVTHDCRSALESVGLDPAVGFLHRDRPGRPGLALDLAEEFRSVLADRLALSLINRRQLRPTDFIVADSGAVTLKDDARKTVLVAYQERKREPLKHAFCGETAEIGLFPWLQAQLMARHLRGDLDAYPPFLWK